MNKTKIEWTDYTYNPVTGCWGPGGTAFTPKHCSYCYAKRVAERFAERIIANDPNPEWPYTAFMPRFHPERLSQPAKVKKPSKIFVCSMADLFGDWVPDEWIDAVLNRCTRADYAHHTYQFLTKNPKRLKDFNPWPSNAWVGTTVTNQADADERLPWLLQVEAPVRFVSHEPLLGEIVMMSALKKEQYRRDAFGIKMSPQISWGIIGAQTGRGAVRPEVGWVMNLAQQYRDAGISLFLKDNLGFKDQPQEFPSEKQKMEAP